MADHDTPLDELIELEPAPDEEAWEAYLLWAMEQLGADESTAVEMETLRRLEEALGMQVPYEIGLLLVIGVPATDGWHRWGDDPAAQLEEWRRGLGIEGVPEDASPLLPLYGNNAVPTAVADGLDSPTSNPILRIENGAVTVVGANLAAWLTSEFGVPLPMWPDTPPRHFPFWSNAS